MDGISRRRAGCHLAGGANRLVTAELTAVTDGPLPADDVTSLVSLG